MSAESARAGSVGGASGGSGAGTGPIGLVINRPGRPLGMEPFLIELVEGIEEVFSPLDRSLRFNIVTSHDQEIAIWRRWADQRSVDAIIMLDLHPDDDRLPVLAELGIPAALLGGPRGGLPFTNVFVDSAAGATDAVDALADLGHRRIAYVGGPHALLHSQTRSGAFLAECTARGCAGILAEGDYYETSGREATLELLRGGEAPTAIFYDNVVMAVAGLGALGDLGLGVPDHVSVMVWDDTALSRLTQPGLSVVAVDVHRLGVTMAEAVLAVLGGASVRTYDAPRPEVRLRGSTAEPPEPRVPGGPDPGGRTGGPAQEDPTQEHPTQEEPTDEVLDEHPDAPGMAAGRGRATADVRSADGPGRRRSGVPGRRRSADGRPAGAHLDHVADGARVRPGPAARHPGLAAGRGTCLRRVDRSPAGRGVGRLVRGRRRLGTGGRREGLLRPCLRRTGGRLGGPDRAGRRSRAARGGDERVPRTVLGLLRRALCRHLERRLQHARGVPRDQRQHARRGGHARHRRRDRRDAAGSSGPPGSGSSWCGRRRATAGGSRSTSTRPGTPSRTTTTTSATTRSSRTARRWGTRWSGRGCC